MAAYSFDTCGHVGWAMLLSKEHHVGFPVAKGFTVLDGLRTVPDHAALWKYEASRLSGVSRLSLAPTLGKVAA